MFPAIVQKQGNIGWSCRSAPIIMERGYHIMLRQQNYLMDILWSTGDWLHAFNSKGCPKFSTFVKRQGLNFNIINSARSALLVSISLEGLETGKQLYVHRYMKDLYNINPSSPNYSFTWDVRIIVKCLIRIPTNFNEQLSAKRGTLLVMVCGQRTREILSVLDIRNINLKNGLVVNHIRDLSKTSTKRFQVKLGTVH